MAQTTHQPIVQELLDMIQKNNWQDKFQQAFDKAKSYNAVEMDEMKTLDDYYAWLDAQMTWVPTENQPGKIVYKHVCLFYFILDQEPVKSLQNAVMPHNPAEPLTPLSLWMRKYIQEFGKWMDPNRSPRKPYSPTTTPRPTTWTCTSSPTEDGRPSTNFSHAITNRARTQSQPLKTAA